MVNYWSQEKKLTKKQIKLAHKKARKLMKHKDKIKEPYALAIWQVKRSKKAKRWNTLTTNQKKYITLMALKTVFPNYPKLKHIEPYKK
jgi:hypothetical protein